MPVVKKKRKSSTGNPKKVDSVFIIMPFGGWFDVYYDDIYHKAIEKAELKPHRLDDSQLPVVLVQEMFQYTRNAKIILADLTGNNPNVCYELGLAHALNKPTILVTDSIENVPFDVSAFRVILYDKNVPDWGEKLKQKLRQSLEEIIIDPQKSLPSRLLATEVANEDQLESEKDARLRLIGASLGDIRHPSQSPSLSLRHQQPSRIGPEEAIVLLSHYLRAKKTNAYIISKLVSLGAPRHWILDRIGRRKKMKTSKK